MTQGQALSVMMAGNSVFLTGAPGAGKTYLLNKFIRLARSLGKNIAVTASTGIAATHIGGTTIHSWSGLGIREELTSRDKSWLASNQRLFKRYNATDILVIDEISMLHGRRLDMVNQVCKLLRQNNAPFGGLQVILVGDLFQLPPVNRGDDLIDFVHLSEAWAELNPKICYLSEQHRQKDGGLLDILEAMRANNLRKSHGEILLARKLDPKAGQATTRLYSHNIDVDAINHKQLAALPSDTKTYVMMTRGAKAKREQLIKSVLAPEILELKIGAEVMFVANNFGEGFVNGSRGQVVGFDEEDKPRVKLAGGKVIIVEPHSWALMEDNKTKAEVTQLPLRLAWAITIHKSQGMSLDAAEIDLSKSFTPGMGYVALSRVRSLDGLYLKGINKMALTLHPDIFEFDAKLKLDSKALAKITEEFAEEMVDGALEQNSAENKNYDGELFNKLRAWRLERARADRVAPFIIAHDSLLIELASRQPANKNQLLTINGMGAKKLVAYGDDIMAVLADNASAMTN